MSPDIDKSISNYLRQIFFLVLGFELRALHLSALFYVGFFKIGSLSYLPGLASNCNPPHLYLLSS
jgi:hypothetical protein